MSLIKRFGGLAIAALAVAAMLGAAQKAAANESITGVITSRGDTSFVLLLEDGQSVTVLLTDHTRITQSGNKKAPAILVPGLRLDAEGDFNADHQLVADHLSFDHHDLKIAYAADATLAPTRKQVAINTENIEKHEVTLGEHGQMLDTHKATIDAHGNTIVANHNEMLSTTAAIGRRVDNLDDWKVVEALTVYFKGGQWDLKPEYVAQLRELADKARLFHGYKIQVQGYASADGPLAFNQVLSEKRSDVVTRTLMQNCGVPPAALVVPVAMGISEQVAENDTAKGRDLNRRVVVTVLQNIGVSTTFTEAGN